MDGSSAVDLYVCPKCGERCSKQILSDAGYHCPRCALEVAHLELAPNGTVRTVFGWLRATGDLLNDRYRVSSVLGRGGFAATYLVTDERLTGKRRAVKEIPKELYDEHETTLLARLRHPAIPDISDRFELNDMVYLVLEFGGTKNLEGERRGRGGRVPVETLVPWMRELCDVLGYLHGQDPPIVHRDLKPDNILLDERGRIMLIDFGIAKEASAGFGTTRTIARSATHGFSPPEQALGTGTDERSDVYALGATMYALLTGTVPPPAHERVAGSELTSPRTLVPTLQPVLEEAILQALNLNINRRQQTIADLGRLFEPGGLEPAAAFPAGSARTQPIAVHTAATGPIAGTAVPAPAPARRLLWPMLAAAGLLLLGAAAGLLALRGREAAKTAESPPPATPVSARPEEPAPAPVAAPPRAEAPTPAAAPAQPATPPAPSGQSVLDEFEQRRRGRASDEPTPAPAPSAPPVAIQKPQPPPRVVQQAPPPRPAPAPRPPAQKPPSGGGGWGTIQRDGAVRTD